MNEKRTKPSLKKEENLVVDKNKPAINFDKRRNSKEIKDARMKKDLNSK